MTAIAPVIRRFESQLGVTENPFGSNLVPYNEWYWGKPTAAAWCGSFVSWCFFFEGLPLPASTAKGFAYTPAGADWFRRTGNWTTAPKVGHVVFFDFPNDGVNRISHVGFVTGVGNGYIETIEGNTDESGSRTGGKVMRRKRSVGMVGYGIPKYEKAPEAIMSSIPNARGFAVMANDDLVVTDWEGAIFHFDADGVPDAIDYIDAYNAHQNLWNGPSPRTVRECIGVYATNAAGQAVPNGSPDAVGYCQVFNDGSRYRWAR